LTFATYVDNVFAVSSCAANAVSLLDEFAEVLLANWQLDMKASSREFIVARGAGVQVSSMHEWKQVTVLECLGHLISDSGSVKPDWDRTVTKMLRSFWANVAHKSIRHVELDRKLRLLDRCCRPQIDFRNTRWPPTKELRAKENALQRKLIGILQGTRLIAGEDVPTYLDRRMRLATAVAQKRGLWGQQTAKQSQLASHPDQAGRQIVS
jgi:hypothetical protein